MIRRKLLSVALLSAILYSSNAWSVPALYTNMDQSLINLSSLSAQIQEKLLGSIFGDQLQIGGLPTFYKSVQDYVSDKITDEAADKIKDEAKRHLSQAGDGFSSVLSGVNGQPSNRWFVEMFGTRSAVAGFGGMGGLIGKISKLNPLSALLGGKADENCGNLSSSDAVTKCYYLNNEDKTISAEDISKIRRNTTAAINKETGELLANANSIANRTSEFEDKKKDVESGVSDASSVSEVLTLRGTSELVGNNLMGTQLDMDIQRLLSNSLTTYQYINISNNAGFTGGGTVKLINLGETK